MSSEATTISRIEDVEQENETTLKAELMCHIGKYSITKSDYSLGIYVLIFVLLYADQNALAPHLTTIQKEFNFTENERDVYLGGYISLGFFLVGGFFSISVGPLVDSVNRTYLLAGLVVFAETACALTYITTNFWQLWIARALTGAGIGGGVPLVYSLIGDLVSQEKRGKANAGIIASFGLGVAIGQQISAAFGEDWRSPFLVISFPAIFLVALMLATMKEPKRGQAEGMNPKLMISEQPTLTLSKAKSAFGKGTIVFALLQAVPSALPFGVVIVFLNDFLIVEKGIENKSIASLITYSFGITILFGTFAGGIMVDRRFNELKRCLLMFSGVTTFISSIPLAIFFLTDTSELARGGQIALYCFLIGIAALLTGFSGGIIKPTMLNVTIPETRGVIFSIQNLVDELGKGLGPFIVSLIIILAGSRAAGLGIACLAFIPTGILQLVMALYVEKDYEKKKEEMLEIYGSQGTENAKLDYP